MAKSSLIGEAVPRVEALSKATGKTIYVIDLELPGMLVGRILRSPRPHARIVRIDTSRAERLRGVKAVITAADFPPVLYGMFLKDQPILARDRVRYVGEKVAAVAAVDLETAHEAASLIDVEYDELEAVFDPLEALAPGAPRLHEHIDHYATVLELHRYHNVCSRSGVVRGNVEEGFARADFVFEDTFTTPMVHQGYLEPHACVAKAEPSGKVTVWTTTPAAFKLRDEVAEILGLPTNMVKVIPGPVGGSFGGKNDLRLEPICARLAQKTGRAVKIVLDREEEFTDGSPRHASVIHLKTGVTKDGRIVARQARMVFDTGAYAEFGPAVASEAAKQISGPYRIPHLDVESLAVYTNKVSCGCCRSHGTPEPTFAYESQMDIIASRLGIDPLEIRLRNAVIDGDHSATGEVYSRTMLQENLRRVAAHVNWEGRCRVGGRGRSRGWGIACGQWRTGGRPTTAIVKLDEKGKVFITTGCVDVTGSDTVMCQIAAEELGVSMADVQIIPIDTDNAPFDAGSSGTRTTHTAGGAVRRASAQIRERVLDVAAQLLEANRDDLVLENGRVFVAGTPEKGLALAQVAQHVLRSTGGPMVATVSSPGDRLPPDPEVIRGLCFGGPIEFIHVAQVAQVEVDPETGEVAVLRFASAHDIGKAINTAGAACQIEGGVAQGIGYALSEEIACQNGVVLSPCGVPYLQPTSQDVPRIDSILVEDVPGLGPYGAKGIAEAPIIPVAPAIANAIYDAVGVRIKSLPITPARIVEALRGNTE